MDKDENASSTSINASGTSVVVDSVTNEDRILRRGDLARIIGL